MGHKLFILFFTLSCTSGLYAVSLFPSQNPVAVGSNVTISVNDTETLTIGTWLFGPSILFLWYPGNVLTGSGHQNGTEFNSSTYQLTLTSVTLKNSGLYVLDALQPKVLAQITLEVQEPVSNLTAFVNATNLVEFNDTVTFTCSANGSPLWFSWTNGSSTVTAGERVVLGNGGRDFIISGVTRYDEGPFKCLVVNNISNAESQQMNLSISYGPSNLRVTASPEKSEYISGSDITLSCSADSKPTASFYWMYNGNPLNVYGPTYDLTHATQNRTGEYTCVAQNAVTLRNVSETKKINIVDPISAVAISAANQSSSPVEGMAFDLNCTVVGPVKSIHWMKNGTYLDANNMITFSNDNSTLRFNQLTLGDDGLYQCAASNAVSNMTSLPYSLLVNYGPNNTAASGSNIAAVGSNVTFSCSSDSRPQSQYSWYFNGLNVNNGSVYVTTPLSKNDSGQYTCMTFNSITGRSGVASVTLTVYAPVSDVMVNMDNQQPIFSKPFTLTCTASGDVEHIQWMKNGMVLHPQNGITFSNDNSTLSFQNLSLSDDGSYQCEASNVVSNMTSPSYDLMVNYGPWNTTISGPTVGAIGHNVTFSCSANSHPTSQYSWFLNSSKVGEGPVLTMTLSPNSGGHYTCMASNNITGSSSNASLELTLIYLISHVVVSAGDQQPIFSQPFTLTCIANGDVEHIQWMKNGMILHPQNGITFSNDNSTLSFQNISLSDDGSYQCEASNIFSNVTSLDYDLMVNYGPWNTTISGPTVGAIGHNVTFSCSANSHPTSQYSWFLNSSKVGEGPVLTMTLSPNSGGHYTCMASNNITGSSSNASLELTLIYLISHVVVSAGDQQPIFSQPFTLTCIANGDVEHIQWMKNGMILHPQNGITFSNDNSTLSFQNISLSDDGSYQCEASNIFSNMTSPSYDLMVNYGPWNTIIEGPTMAEEGSNVTFNCTAISHPHSRYSWFHNTSKVGDGPVLVKTALSLNSSGLYTCMAINDITGRSSNASLELTVIETITAVDVIPDRTIPLASQRFKLTCDVKGRYNTLHWLQNNQNFQPSDRVIFAENNTSVTFNTLQTADDGRYQCVASNELRPYVSRPYDLAVIFGPQSVQIIVRPGIPPVLTCQAVSQPPAVYHWIFENNTVVGNQSSIELPIKYILGSNYTCVAKNPLTNVTVYTSQVVNSSNAVVGVQASVMLMALFALLLPVLEECL
ncbi:hemicentin-1-like [Carassius carassius]|uniref:hemicentin-1-like n=1 Tax=Carassius carassius TaxID=217509 RepID=UPI002868BE82|nr:hemicentin-1-like [Carassius carassius]